MPSVANPLSKAMPERGRSHGSAFMTYPMTWQSPIAQRSPWPCGNNKGATIHQASSQNRPSKLRNRLNPSFHEGGNPSMKNDILTFKTFLHWVMCCMGASGRPCGGPLSQFFSCVHLFFQQRDLVPHLPGATLARNNMDLCCMPFKSHRVQIKQTPQLASQGVSVWPHGSSHTSSAWWPSCLSC